MYEVNHLFLVEYVTPYTRDYFLVKALSYESVKIWALDNLYDLMMLFRNIRNLARLKKA